MEGEVSANIYSHSSFVQGKISEAHSSKRTVLCSGRPGRVTTIRYVEIVFS